jgi:hypothetical protein
MSNLEAETQKVAEYGPVLKAENNQQFEQTIPGRRAFEVCREEQW